MDSKEKFDDPPAENLHGLLSDLKPLIVTLKKCEKDMSQPKSEEIAWEAAQEADVKHRRKLPGLPQKQDGARHILECG